MKTSQPDKVVPLKRAKCPTCGKAAMPETKPFCSKRCADVDLGRWLDGGYRIPTDEIPGDGDLAEGLEDET